MKIKVEKWIADDDVSYHIVDMQKCCDKILHSQSIRLNYEYDEDYAYNNVIYSVKLSEIEHIEDYYANYVYQTINYCPFCGEKIEIEIIKTIDKSTEYTTLARLRKILWDKCYKTDSKKEEAKLKVEVQVLDKQINDILDSDTFEQYIKENEKVDR